MRGWFEGKEGEKEGRVGPRSDLTCTAATQPRGYF